ncbi:17107_t:CDS:2, partial [Gigaspora rosea]
GIYPSNTVTTIKQKNFKKNEQENHTLKNKRPFQEYKIPDKYAVITEWGRGAKHKIVYCQIDYIDNKSLFLIKYGVNFENIVISAKSTSQAILLYEKLKTVQKIRESYNKSKQVKPTTQCTETTLEKRARIKFGLDDKIKTKRQLQKTVQAIDQGQISRDTYCKLAATEQLLP